MAAFENPYRPGSGHMPPHLAGRAKEIEAFEALLGQDPILKNVLLTGLRGVGKTVLLERWKPIAIKKKWLWAGTDLSESTSVSEETLVTRLLADLSVVTSGIVLSQPIQPKGFSTYGPIKEERVGYEKLVELYKLTPGLPADKLKGILEFVWACLKPHGVRGIVFAYDEAQTMSDHAAKEQYPLSLFLDVFQSIQKKGIPFMLVLAGLPTLFSKLVDARTFSERMFEVITLAKLDDSDSREAITEPLNKPKCTVIFTAQSVDQIVETSGGYPYFIQFICREAFDVFIQKIDTGDALPSVPIHEITRKLDQNFFAGRWGKATDRQRDLLSIIAMLDTCDEEFTVQEIVVQSKTLKHPFSSSHVNQMLVTLTENGLIYKNRHGRYSFAVPLLGRFVTRQMQDLA
jgi:hypothetical protein